MFGGSGAPIPSQDVGQVSANWPEGNLDVRLANYLCQVQQKWTIAPFANAGGYLGSPYFKIAIAGTDRVLAVGGDAELIALPAFTGGAEQLWRIEQLPDLLRLCHKVHEGIVHAAQKRAPLEQVAARHHHQGPLRGLAQGQRYGLIKLGSRLDLYFPLEWEVNVRVNDTVRGGLTTVARMLKS